MIRGETRRFSSENASRVRCERIAYTENLYVVRVTAIIECPGMRQALFVGRVTILVDTRSAPRTAV